MRLILRAARPGDFDHLANEAREYSVETIAAVMLTWIIAKTGLVTPALPPIILIPRHRLVEIAFGPNPPAYTGVSALYDRNTSRIYMLDSWKDTDLLNKSELVHELVHHVQHTNNVVAPCLRAHERQAIHLQIQWLREQGVNDPYKFLGINELYVVLVSSCHDE